MRTPDLIYRARLECGDDLGITKQEYGEYQAGVTALVCPKHGVRTIRLLWNRST